MSYSRNKNLDRTLTINGKRYIFSSSLERNAYKAMQEANAGDDNARTGDTPEPPTTLVAEEVIFTTSATLAARLVVANGYDEDAGKVTVTQGNKYPEFYDGTTLPYGIVDRDKTHVPGDTAICYRQGRVKIAFQTAVGEVPTLNTKIYSGTSGYVATAEVALGREELATVLGDVEFVESFPGWFDVYRAEVMINIPTAFSTEVDGTLSDDTFRIPTNSDNGDVFTGDLVVFDNDLAVRRYDPAVDNVEDIIGITPENRRESVEHIAIGGLLRLEEGTDFTSSTIVNGTYLYSDVSTPHRMTDDPASGILVARLVDDTSSNEIIEVLKPRRVGADAYNFGGATAVTKGIVYNWDGDWTEVDNSSTTNSTGLVAIATATGTGVEMFTKGIVQLAANPTGATAGSILYIGASGDLTATAPTASNSVVRKAGYAIDAAGKVMFDPCTETTVNP